MATTDHPTAANAEAASDVAAALRDAELAHLVAVGDGDAVAAAGLLARGCDAAGLPFHVGVVRTAAERDARLADADPAATAVVLGASAPEALALDGSAPVSPVAHAAAVALGAEPDRPTALAGVVASGVDPARAAPDLLDAAGLERVPGLAVPTTDLADGVAHSGLVHAAFSGDVDAARDALTGLGLADADATALDERDARRVASHVALTVADDAEAPPRAAAAVERLLRPYRSPGPFGTLAGHADVLAALAERSPGTGVALAAGRLGASPALDAWRDHGREAHAAVRRAATAPDGDLLVARTEGPLAAVARLLRDFRSTAPAVLAVGDGAAAVATDDRPVAERLHAAAAAVDGSSLARGSTGFARYDPAGTERFVEAFREAP